MSKSASCLAMLALFVSLLGCSGKLPRPGEGREASAGQRATLTIKGSDTMIILAQRWAERFHEENADATVQVSGGGSGTGIAALLNGTTDIANSSRPIKARERDQVRTTYGVEVAEFEVALDAIAIYVHASNPVPSLTIAELKRIYRGRITNWRELGGRDAPIILYSRENNSGTYAYFKEKVLEEEDFAAQAQTLPGTAAVIHAVTLDRNGIGYGGIAFGAHVRTVPLVREGSEAVLPSLENATAGTYPLARKLFLYTAGEPTALARRYIYFARSLAGQSVVEGVGFFPLARTETP